MVIHSKDGRVIMQNQKLKPFNLKSLSILILTLIALPCFATASSISSSAASLKKFLLQPHHCKLLENDHFTSCYSEHFKNTIWAVHQLEREQVLGHQKRTNDYRVDNRVSKRVLPTNYRRTGFDRGHLVPASDMRKNFSSMTQTFFMTNMAPQRPEFNRGIWSVLEKKIRRDFVATRQKDNVFIYTGMILSDKLPTLPCEAAIPEWFYKIIYNQTTHTISSYLIDNHRYSSSELDSFRVSVDRIEALTGLDFFSFLPKLKEDQLESKI